MNPGIPHHVSALAFAAAALLAWTPAPTGAQVPPPGTTLPVVERTLPNNRVLTHREQAPLIRARVEQRFDELLPGLMRRAGIDMWIIVSREYNDDPVFRSMAPPR